MLDTPMSRIALTATPIAAGTARGFVALVLSHWRIGSLIDAATLVVSELVTNSVRAAPEADPGAPGDPADSPRLSVQLLVQPTALRVSVRDSDPGLPCPQVPGEEAESGRGLLLVRAVSDQWGAYRLPGGGKVVWAKLLLPVTPRG